MIIILIRKTFLPILVLLLASLISACEFIETSETGKNGQTTLFDGQVTYCYSSPLAELAKQGKTGVFELDKATKPSLKEINDILKPYGRALAEAPEGDPSWVPSGVSRWRHLCKIKLPETAIDYSRYSRATIDPDYDMSTSMKYPGKDPSLDKYYVTYRVWFIDDRMVHVEVKASPNEPIMKQ